MNNKLGSQIAPQKNLYVLNIRIIFNQLHLLFEFMEYIYIDYLEYSNIPPRNYRCKNIKPFLILIFVLSITIYFSFYNEYITY